MTNHNFIINPVSIGGNTIERVVVYKLLGVYISNGLKWTHHVDYVIKKANNRLYSLRVLKQCGSPPVSLAKVLVTIVPPILEYAVPARMAKHTWIWYGMVWYGNFIYTRYFLQVHLHSSIEN